MTAPPGLRSRAGGRVFFASLLGCAAVAASSPVFQIAYQTWLTTLLQPAKRLVAASSSKLSIISGKQNRIALRNSPREQDSVWYHNTTSEDIVAHHACLKRNGTSTNGARSEGWRYVMLREGESERASERPCLRGASFLSRGHREERNSPMRVRSEYCSEQVAASYFSGVSFRCSGCTCDSFSPRLSSLARGMPVSPHFFVHFLFSLCFFIAGCSCQIDESEKRDPHTGVLFSICSGRLVRNPQ